MKRLTPGTVTIGVFAILFGLAAAYAARRYFDVPPEVAQPIPRQKTVAVLFSKINLPKYARIRDEDVTIRQVPVDKVPAGVLTSKSRALFRMVKSTIMADEPVADEALFGVGEVPKLSDRLTPGHRAVTLAVSSDSALNGMIQPESHVDITLTVADKHPEMGGLATMTVMRNVRVLATSDARFPRTEDRPQAVRNMTVSVTPEDGNKLILAQRYGSLSVALCSTVDAENAAETVAVSPDQRNLVNKQNLLGLAPLPIPEEQEEPTVYAKTVEVWRGGKRVEVTFNANEMLEAINATEVAEGREPMQALPVSVQQSATKDAPKKGCKNCGKKGTEASASTPTRAPARADRAGAATVGSPHVASQVLQVEVEAHQLGSGM